MQDTYPVYFGNQQAGKVQVLRQGLYLRFICRCRLTGDVVCRLYASWSGGTENLGVVIPMDGGFGLDTKIPAKRIGPGDLQFALRPKGECPGTFVPICPEEPFAYIERLKDSFLVRRNGQVGILIYENEGTSPM